MKELIQKIRKENIGKIEENVSLKKYTTYKVGGRADLVVYPKTVEKLVLLIRILNQNNINYKIWLD